VVQAVVSATNKPVTVKIRLGFTKDQINAVEISKIIEASGAAAVGVHGRTRDQYYSGPANWSEIRKVKDSISIPVIGSGDVFSGEDALRMMAETGCDFVMIARGAMGNPWIFKEAVALWEGREKPDPPLLSEKLKVILLQLNYLVDEKGEYAAVREMRKQIGWYLKGFHGAAEVRRRANSISTVDEIKALLAGIA
jgi:tRNA-dihydrouridine synthase B